MRLKKIFGNIFLHSSESGVEAKVAPLKQLGIELFTTKRTSCVYENRDLLTQKLLFR